MEKGSGRISQNSMNGAEIWIKHGAEQFFSGKHEKAVEYYDRAIAIEPGSARAWHAKANALEELGRTDEAIQCYDTAVKCDPLDAECWYNMGIALSKAGKAAEAQSCKEHALRQAMGR